MVFNYDRKSSFRAEQGWLHRAATTDARKELSHLLYIFSQAEERTQHSTFSAQRALTTSSSTATHLRQPVQDAQRSDGGGFEADISTGDGDVSPWAVKTRLIRVRGRSCWRSSRRGMCLRSAACCASDIIEIIDEPVSMQFAAALRSAATAHRRSSSPIWQESRRRSCSGLA
jgi:hypothetical protein